MTSLQISGDDQIAEILDRLDKLEARVTPPSSSDDPPDDAGEPPGGHYLDQADLGPRYRKHGVTIRRWIKDPHVNFPEPDLVVNGHKHWRLSTLTRWERLSAGRRGGA